MRAAPRGAPVTEPAAIRADREERQRGLIRGVIDEIAAEGNAVIVAHAASVALAGTEGILRVLVTASPEERVKRLVEAEDIANADAARAVMESDQARADYFVRSTASGRSCRRTTTWWSTPTCSGPSTGSNTS